MTRRDLTLLADALGQALSNARRMGGETGPRVDAVLLTIEEIQRALTRENHSFNVGKFREAVRKAAGEVFPERVADGGKS